MIMQLVRRLRWWTGFGYSAFEFQDRYRHSVGDAWSYLNSDAHAARLTRILNSMPEHVCGTLLEVGCAEGFMTRPLAEKADHVIACDVSEEAIRRAQNYCKHATNIEFLCLDIRNGLPASQIEFCVMSDVLYYLSIREIRDTIANLSLHMTQTGRILFANEWHSNYRHLSDPEIVCKSIESEGLWHCEWLKRTPLSAGAEHWIATFYRTEIKTDAIGKRAE
jgi:SAM-dependent methyltransferase